ncbi:cell division control protein Cdc6 [Saccharata proteae CBS 121410]|uniref:Cell division control protein n=1 Tax=Saccharata proteae CBS 121410 TaxID=1314787 RepID=A0A9P4I0I4_9PEZI|nr:cell division control protein Cdc6 [Saccharata proteae CBS 121410]
MAATTVLGKRSRNTPAKASTSARATRATRSSTRTTQFVVLDNNENENPFITPAKKHDAVRDDSVIDDEDRLVEEIRPVKRARGRPPIKHRRSDEDAPVDDRPITKPKTPSTPRHRDALANKVPVTPRHRVVVGGKPMTPRTPRTGQDPVTPRSLVPTVYNDARQLFIRGVQPDRLTGRDNERAELQQFVSTRVEKKSSGCLYVSGPPGTGKSALVSEVCQEFADDASVKCAYLNCMSAKSAREIYFKLLEEIDEADGVLEGDESDTLRAIIKERRTSYVVTLDEIDHLLELDLELLYKLFEWALRPGSSLVLIGIANALDLTDRFLPRLKSRGLKPQLLPFMPYNAAQIGQVITTKLRTLLPKAHTGPADFVPFLHPTAIRFLSAKVAGQNGDLRNAFDICRRTIDLIETETRNQHAKKAEEQQTPTPTPSPTKTPLIDNLNLCSPPTKTAQRQSSISALTALTAPRATIAHMANITAAVFSNGSKNRLRTLNLQQRAVLCALCALEHRLRTNNPTMTHPTTPSKSSAATATAPTIKALYTTYSHLCTRDSTLHPLTTTEFRDVVGSLETLSLISTVEQGRTGSFVKQAGTPSRRGRKVCDGFGGEGLGDERRVASCVGVGELKEGVLGAGEKGSGVLRGILEGEGLL